MTTLTTPTRAPQRPPSIAVQADRPGKVGRTVRHAVVIAKRNLIKTARTP